MRNLERRTGEANMEPCRLRRCGMERTRLDEVRIPYGDVRRNSLHAAGATCVSPAIRAQVHSDAVGRVASAPAFGILLSVRGGRKRHALRQKISHFKFAGVRRVGVISLRGPPRAAAPTMSPTKTERRAGTCAPPPRLREIRRPTGGRPTANMKQSENSPNHDHRFRPSCAGAS